MPCRNQLLRSRNTASSIAKRQAALDPSLRAVSRLWRPKVRLIDNVIGVCVALEMIKPILVRQRDEWGEGHWIAMPIFESSFQKTPADPRESGH